MNPKIDKLARDIEKTQKKIAELQEKLADLQNEKTKLENEDYGAISRSFNFSPKELAEFLKAYEKGRTESTGLASPVREEQEASHEE